MRLTGEKYRVVIRCAGLPQFECDWGVTDEGEERDLESLEFIWTEGNYSCDCNKRGISGTESNAKCGDAHTLHQLDVYRPDGSRAGVWTCDPGGWFAGLAEKPTRYAITEKGVVKAKASPELLPEMLRKLPGDLVTKDIEVEDKAHKEDVDTPHVILSIAKDRARLERGEKPLDPLAKDPEPVPDEDPRLDQRMIDIRRLCVLREWARTQRAFIARGRPSDVSVKHLWFPENDHRNYEMRSGNPPPDSHRPRHLRGFRLEIDLGAKELPAEVAKLLEERGVKVPSGYVGLVRNEMNLNRVLTADGEAWGQ